MLGKQGWKLQTEQDTIVTRIYKAKYFPKTDFLGGHLGHNPSFIWCSIFASQVLVRDGQRWHVGNGSSINVWKAPWLRSLENSFVSKSLCAWYVEFEGYGFNGFGGSKMELGGHQHSFQ